MTKEQIMELGWNWNHKFEDALIYGGGTSLAREGFLKQIGDEHYWLTWFPKDGSVIINRNHTSPECSLGYIELKSIEELREWMKKLEAYPKASENFNIGVDGFIKKTY